MGATRDIVRGSEVIAAAWCDIVKPHDITAASVDVRFARYRGLRVRPLMRFPLIVRSQSRKVPFSLNLNKYLAHIALRSERWGFLYDLVGFPIRYVS